MKQNLLQIECVKSISEIEKLSIKSIDLETESLIEAKYFLFTKNIKEAKIRIINFLWKRGFIVSLKFRISEYLNTYRDDDLRIKRIIVLYLKKIGNEDFLKELLASEGYRNLEDAAIKAIYNESFTKDEAKKYKTGAIHLSGDIFLNIPTADLSPVERTAQRVEFEYGKVWDIENRKIRRHSNDGKSSALAMMHLGAYEAMSKWGILNDSQVGDVLQDKFLDLGLENSGIDTRFRIGASGENYHVVSFEGAVLSAKTLIEANKIDTVVELGSGSSANLFQCYNALKYEFRDKVTFVGAEFTEQGREAAGLISKLQPEVDFHCVPFNFHEPDFGFLKELKCKNVLFLTNHSIEQIPSLSTDLFYKMIEATEKCYCVHCEPVGWQLLPELVKARKKRDEKFFGMIKSNLTLQPSSINSENSPFHTKYKKNTVSYNGAWWSYIKNYNSNLVDIIKSLEENEIINLKKVIKNHTAGNSTQNIVANPFNPSSFLYWEKV